MAFLSSIICVVLAFAIMIATDHAAATLVGLEKQIVQVSGAILSGAMFVLFLVFSIIGQLGGPERCDECGRPTDPRLAYSEEPNTKNPACRECGRPLPESQYNA